MTFYKPTFLFRQNVIRCPGSPQSSAETISPPTSPNSSNKTPTWLMNLDNSSDASIMNKVCYIDRTNIKSNYWKEPDNKMHLTSLAVNSTQSDSPLLAVSSASESESASEIESESASESESESASESESESESESASEIESESASESESESASESESESESAKNNLFIYELDSINQYNRNSPEQFRFIMY